jgi:uncharacterized delta-60 repeat protein
MTWLPSFRRLLNAPSRRPARRRPAWRPGLERLEERAVPTAGALDPTFGAGGKVTTDLFPRSIPTYSAAQAVQADGKIVVAGLSVQAGGEEFAVVRYDTDGSLDSTFGGDGRVTIDFGLGSSSDATGLALQPDGKIIVTGSCSVPGASNTDFAAVRLNDDGTLDTSFGNGGKQTIDFGGNDGALGVALQSDGKIVMMGATDNYYFSVTRLNAYGNLDTSFDTDGKHIIFFGSIRAVALQPDNKFLVAGETTSGDAVMRLNSDGTTDNSFGSDGTEHVPGFAFGPTSLAVQSDGKIVLAGSAGPQGINFGVERVNNDGSLDTSFGSGGLATITFGNGSSANNDQATAVAIDPIGRVIVAGSSSVNAGDFAVALLSSNGSLDTSFNGSGKQTIDFGTPAFAYGLALQSGGKIVAVGQTGLFQNSVSDFAVARLNVDGGVDNSFGTGGEVTTPFPRSAQEQVFGSHSVAVQPDGKIVMVGSTESSVTSPPSGAFIVARYKADGSLDNTFGTNGRAAIDFSGTFVFADSVAVQSDGKLVVAGVSQGGGASLFAVARLNSDGSLDTSFGSAGTRTIAIGTVYDYASSIALQSDGKIVLAGQSNTDSGSDFAAVRLNSDGSLDTSFDGDGKQTIHFAGVSAGAADLALQPDGKFVLAGQTSSFQGGQHGGFAVARLNGDGSLDTAFGAGGERTIDFDNSPYSFASGLALQSDGRIVVAGQAFIGQNFSKSDFALARLNGDGSLDTSFAAGGKQTIDFGSFDDYAVGVAVQADGRIVAAGATSQGTGGSDFAVARLNNDGSLDDSFGSGGTVITDFSTGAADASGLALQPDGKIVVAGEASSQATGYDFTLVRYLGDPQVTIAIDPTASPEMVSANLQNVVTFLQDSSTDATPPPIELPVTPTTLETAVTAVNSLSAPTVPITITLNLGSGSVGDTTVNPPLNVTLVINGDGGSVTFVGHSPAFTVTGGNVVVTNATFLTDTDSPTILVTGGHLTLRNDVIQESTGFSDAAIAVSGGTVDLGSAVNPGGNTINVNGSGVFVRNTTSTPVAAVDDAFTINGATLAPSSLSGLVWEDFNDDGQVDFGEKGIGGVTVTLTGADDLGNAVNLSQLTDGDGAYSFLNLRPGSYNLTETQPAGYLQGADSVGTAGGSLAATDRFFTQLGLALNGLNYNYGERPTAGSGVQHGQTAGIGFWNNKNGQALIKALNGGSSSSQLANWLAATLPNTFGIHAGANNLTGKSNAFVAALFQQDFVMKGVKLDAQVLATALSVYVTNATLDSTQVGASYGFTVSGDGVGMATANVGSNGDAFGVANNTVMSLMDLLLATDAQAIDGVLYNGNSTRRNEANNLFSAVNQAGGL